MLFKHIYVLTEVFKIKMIVSCFWNIHRTYWQWQMKCGFCACSFAECVRLKYCEKQKSTRLLLDFPLETRKHLITAQNYVKLTVRAASISGIWTISVIGYIMNFKAGFRWLYDQICDYNLFLPDEQEYSNEDNSTPTITQKQQKCTTWLYILLLFGKSSNLCLFSDIFIIFQSLSMFCFIWLW